MAPHPSRPPVAGLSARVALISPLLLGALAMVAGACESEAILNPVLVEEDWECTVDEDCELGNVCSIGLCVAGCRQGGDRCPAGEVCVGVDCFPIPDSGSDGPPDAGEGGSDATVLCTADMVLVGDELCMDRYEASRPNATSTSQGDDNSMATSRENVLPWFPITKETAAFACAAAGKRLCTPDEFQAGCSGSAETTYPYGNDYDPLICNGIDTYCSCGSGSPCEGISPCPYPHCFNAPPEGQSVPAQGCGSMMHVMPTGSFAQCITTYGAMDVSGNVWELVDDGTPEGHFRGGAYNCIDSELLHRCDYEATNILAKGFRCCKSL